MKTIHQQFYITMKKDLQKITDTAKKQDGLKFKVKEEENKVSLLVFYQH